MADIRDIVSNKIQLYLSAAAHLVDSSLFLSFRTYKYLGYFQLSTVAQAARPPDTFPVLTRAPLPRSSTAAFVVANIILYGTINISARVCVIAVLKRIIKNNLITIK